ncbi:hypothetical protein ACFFX0_26005 [Citricoccus parietis]|uniref:Uncharacterized protein n=1 Tax=Citricoccus parietis TaxID=592307 RepID=A0ABV5G7R4_9MICC
MTTVRMPFFDFDPPRSNLVSGSLLPGGANPDGQAAVPVLDGHSVRGLPGRGDLEGFVRMVRRDL